jgi:hypothetical protein
MFNRRWYNLEFLTGVIAAQLTLDQRDFVQIKSGEPILYPGMFQGGDRVSKTQCGAFNSYPGCQFIGFYHVEVFPLKNFCANFIQVRDVIGSISECESDGLGSNPNYLTKFSYNAKVADK